MNEDASSSTSTSASTIHTLSTDKERLAFLGRVSAALLSSRDYRETLQRLSDLAVPALGDWCAVDMVREDGRFERLAVTHSDPAKVALAHEVWRLAPPQPDAPTGLPNVVRTGRTELVPDIPPETLSDEAGPPEVMRVVRSLGLRSYIVVPLIAKQRTLGGLTLVHAESGRRYSEADLPIVDEFARLAAMAVENACLFESIEAALAREKEARQQAERSQSDLRTFIDHLPELAWTALPDGHIDYYNRRWYEYTGTTFEDMQGWGWQRLHDPALLPAVIERWQHSLRTGEPFEMEFTLRGGDGVPRWFLTRVSPARDAEGRIVRWFGTNTDIHAIKVAQALSREMEAQSHQVELLLLEMRDARDVAERRVAELEAERAPEGRQ